MIAGCPWKISDMNAVQHCAQAWVDSRYDSVTEERRQQLFEEFRSMLAEEVAAADMQHSQVRTCAAAEPRLWRRPAILFLVSGQCDRTGLLRCGRAWDLASRPQVTREGA